MVVTGRIGGWTCSPFLTTVWRTGEGLQSAQFNVWLDGDNAGLADHSRLITSLPRRLHERIPALSLHPPAGWSSPTAARGLYRLVNSPSLAEVRAEGGLPAFWPGGPCPRARWFCTNQPVMTATGIDAGTSPNGWPRCGGALVETDAMTTTMRRSAANEITAETLEAQAQPEASRSCFAATEGAALINGYGGRRLFLTYRDAIASVP